MNMIYYTDLVKGTLRLRPEVGIGLSRIKLVYGYNIPLTEKMFEKVNKHNVCLHVLLGLKRKSKKDKGEG